MQDHLRPVPDGTTGQPQAPAPEADKPRRTTIPRTAKPLPTDRLKFDAQKRALKAIAISSDFGARAVGSREIAQALSVVETTASLNNAFFVDSGLVVQEARGRYKPTAVANEFARKHSFNDAEAGLLLAPTLAQTWYFRAVQRRLQISAASKAHIIEALALEAGATKERAPQLDSLLDWLNYAGLIEVSGGNVVVGETAPSPATTGAGGGASGGGGGEPPAPEDDPPGAGTTTRRGQERPQEEAPVIGLSFDFSLTASDLAQLTPDQIRAVFEAVGSVMAVKASMT